MEQSEQTTQLAEVLYLLKKLEGARLPERLREKIDLMLKRLRRMARQGLAAGEYEAVAKYIDWCLSIPWDRYVEDNLDLANAKEVLDRRHYGHENVKELVLEYLAIINRKEQLGDHEFSAPVLAFVGVQGSGKTTLAMAIAEALGRPFFRISLGAIGRSSELRGSPHAHVSGQPGQIVRCLVGSQSMNPVVLLDEFDKVSGMESLRKDYMAIMLEVLDPQQNKTFRDWYIDYPVDLSKVLFIATANRFTTLSRELLDRLEIIEFTDYDLSVKEKIAKSYLFPQVLHYAGLQENELVIEDGAWGALVDAFGRDQGVRRLERNLQRLARKVIKKVVTGEQTHIVVTAENVQQFIKDALPSIEDIRHIDYTLSDSFRPVENPVVPGQTGGRAIGTAIQHTAPVMPAQNAVSGPDSSPSPDPMVTPDAMPPTGRSMAV